MIRNAKIDRITNETDIKLAFKSRWFRQKYNKNRNTFFDHMLDQFTFHSQIDLELDAQGGSRD